MEQVIQTKLEEYLKKLCSPGTPMEIRLMKQTPRAVKATGDVVYHEGFPYVTGWGVGYKDPHTNMEGWVMAEFVYLKS